MGHLGEEFKHHLVGWDNLCSPMASGGSGIQKLTMLNQSLLGKRLWWFQLERD